MLQVLLKKKQQQKTQQQQKMQQQSYVFIELLFCFLFLMSLECKNQGNTKHLSEDETCSYKLNYSRNVIVVFGELMLSSLVQNINTGSIIDFFQH